MLGIIYNHIKDITNELRSASGHWSEQTTEYGRIRETFGNYDFFIKKKVLDLGCSTGETSCEILDNCPVVSVYGVDVSNYAIYMARKNYPRSALEFSCLDGCNVPENRKEDFDVALALNNIIYDERYPDPSIIRNIGDWVKDGGIVILGSTDREISGNVKGRYAIFEKINGDLALRSVRNPKIHLNHEFRLGEEPSIRYYAERILILFPEVGLFWNIKY